MKSTVKRWCKDFGYTWYGPGVFSAERYDYKIHFEKGLAAMFRTAHGPCQKPRHCTTNRGVEFLIFPVYSQFVGKKEMSRSQFIQATAWIKECLAGRVCEYTQWLAARNNECEDGPAHAGQRAEVHKAIGEAQQ